MSHYLYHKKERISSHKRSFKPGQYVTIRDHLSSAHKFYGDWSPTYFEKLAKPLGQAVVSYIKALIGQSAYPEIGYKQCLGIIALKKTYATKRINNACKRALSFHRYGYRIIENILENKMDLQQPTSNETTHIEPHQNIRGAQYYQ